jgi:ketosteroid isomerase-like protein
MTTTATRPLAELENDLNAKILSGAALEAFDEYYAPDCTMQEGSDEPFVGKDLNRKREEDFFSSVTELRALELKDVAIGDGVTMSTWHFDVTIEGVGPVAFDQVAVRHWEDGQVVKERFFKA